ncbi:hypothetical protein ACPFP2_06305 [Micromonospora citrea]|uniref:hypothetical protein n=1 Tax=Micromonospora citrea TaxID=47855 RepID=UPI003C3BCA42
MLAKLRDYLIESGSVTAIRVATIRRILHERGVSWQATKMWKTSNGPLARPWRPVTRPTTATLINLGMLLFMDEEGGAVVPMLMLGASGLAAALLWVAAHLHRRGPAGRAAGPPPANRPPVLVLSQYVEQFYAHELLAGGQGAIGNCSRTGSPTPSSSSTPCAGSPPAARSWTRTSS